MKKRIFKTLRFSTLALLTACTGVVAFAPLTTIQMTSASEPTTTTSGLGLDPKNDPVVYTTESGLEIKFGGFDIEQSLASGALTGYPYFTMGTYNGNSVNWIIIGRNPNISIFDHVNTFVFDTWKNKTKYLYQQYFFENIYETNSPAGNLIDNLSSSKTFIKDFMQINLNSIVSDPEIPEGCVLVISECNLGTSVFNATASNQSTYIWTYSRGSRYRYQSDNGNGNTWNNKTNGNLYTAITNLYTNGLGLTNEEKALIQPQKLITKYSAKSSTNGISEAETITGGDILHDTYETDGNTLYHFFPLAIGWTGASENFVLSTYLKSNALKVSYVIGTKTAQAWWTRTGWYAIDSSAVNTDGSNYWGPGIGVTAVYGVRPAFVLNLQ